MAAKHLIERDIWKDLDGRSAAQPGLQPTDDVCESGPRRVAPRVSQRPTMRAPAGDLELARHLSKRGKSAVPPPTSSEDEAANLATYLELLAPLTRVPRVRVTRAKLLGMQLDASAGFILSRVDGTSSLEAILDACSMPRGVVLRTLYDFSLLGIIELR